RQRLVEKQEKGLATLFQRWRERREAEVGQVRELVRLGNERRSAWAEERGEFLRRGESLRAAQLALAEQALALEEARREFLKEVDRPETAAKRLERLRRRWQNSSVAS